MKSALRILLVLSSASLIAACQATPTQTTASSSTVTASADIQAAAQKLAAMDLQTATQTGRALGSFEMLEWAQKNQSASAELKLSTALSLLSSHPELVSLLSSSQLAGGDGGPGGPGGPGGGMGGPPAGMGGGPGGLPPNLEEIRSKYPELATSLEAMQSLSPEERRTKMDALLAEHPEYQEVLMPPGGGPGGPPPSGMPSGQPPVPPVTAASATVITGTQI